ncbi:unnamed protein product [Hydatigera taeniaeformis]|uniref:Cleavage stimulation factor 50 kDa subunit n=1 Tax=Hydatigena taeniaeformis TaxID=6205 RepID=A0A0R3X1L4_HYDTA|nr:unnamed protein product [Hydatigera taeniaeformis]
MSLRERDVLYRLIISQLFHDGYQAIAINLMNEVTPSVSCGPSARLLKLVKLGLSIADDEQDRSVALEGDNIPPGTGIDLEIESESSTMAPEAALYETCYVTAHKAACRAAAFNSTGALAFSKAFIVGMFRYIFSLSSIGQLIATGSHDSSIKILDVERMLAKGNSGPEHSAQETPQQQMEAHPVIRTLYDHTAEVTCVDFHPDASQQILVSGSKDYTIKFFDFSNPSVKKAQRSIPEASPIKTLHFHPSGNYLLVGTHHKTLRIYSVNTCQCFVSAVPEDQHNGAVTMARWAPNANYFVTSSVDGSFKIWDGVSGRCVSTFEAAHDGLPVCSAVFSRNSKIFI